MKTKFAKFAVLAAFAITLGTFVPSSEACTGCRVAGEMVEKTEKETVSAGKGLSWSVLFMLGTVSVLGGGMGVLIKRTIAEVDRNNAKHL